MKTSSIYLVEKIFLAIFLSYLTGIEYFGSSRDVMEYQDFYIYLDAKYDGRFEPLYYYLSLIIKSLTNDFSIYLFIVTLISMSLKIFVLSKFRLFHLSLVWYSLMLLPSHELTQYRVSLALGLVYCSLYFLSMTKSRLSVLLLFIASVMCHYSMIAFLPFILFWRVLSVNRTVKYLHIAIGILMLILAKASIYQIVTVINTTASAVTVQVPTIFSAQNIILFIILVIGATNWYSIPNHIRPFFYISCYGFVLWWLFFDIPIFAHRLYETTTMSYFIWVSFQRGRQLQASIVLMSVLAGYLGYRVFSSLDPFFI